VTNVADPCARRNPLVRSGLTQDGRRRAELAADYFQPDERDLADLILFGQRYARHIRYFDAGNKPLGDWAAFFESDIAASLAALARLPVDEFRGFQIDLETWLRADPNRAPSDLSAHATLVFHLPVILLEQLGAHHARLPVDHELSRAIPAMVASDLAEPVAGLIAWYKGAITVPGAGNALFEDTGLDPGAYNVSGGPADPRIRLSSTIAAAVAQRPALSAVPVSAALLDSLPEKTWTDLYNATAADTSPYVDAIDPADPQQRYEQVYDALSYNLLSTAVERIYRGIERVRRDAGHSLGTALTDLADHAPHYGLWLAFLELFRHARGALNEFTGRHLDFYFREVLALRGRAAAPDSVHLLFELARGRSTHLLRSGTAFRAGKDKLGRLVSYALANDIVLNRAVVAEVRGLQVVAGPLPTDGLRAIAAPVAKSMDGLREVELPKDDPTWSPFGPAVSPDARVGFAVADRKLFLREGTRTIILRAELSTSIGDLSISPHWHVRLTGAKGWFEVPPSQVTTLVSNYHLDPPDQQSAGGKPATGQPIKMLQLAIALSPNDPPVVPLDAKTHGDEHEPGLPMVEVSFDFAASGSGPAFAVLRATRVTRVQVACEVAGLRDLMVVAGGAVADAAKPFAAFGAQPRSGASLILGSSEIFSKAIAAWHLMLEWQTPYADSFFRNFSASAFNPAVAVLTGGRWTSVQGVKGRRGETVATLLGTSAGSNLFELEGADLVDGLTPQTLANPPLEAASVNGFVRLRLKTDFGHREFAGENARALIAMANGTAYNASTNVKTETISGMSMPRPPYEAIITGLQAGYLTTRNPVERVTVLYPFGVSGLDASRHLFPQLPFEGALLIGVRDFEPPARLTLLVQIADGTGDPLKPAPSLEFACLSGDEWLTLESQAVDDKTRNFSTSGVLGLNVPGQADTNHRCMPAGLHWIRICAPRDASALNRLLSIDAQAARAVFVDAGNDPAFLETPLAAGTISKSVVPDPAVKKVSQPYSSSDGRPPETPPAFVTRVSERLRHKDRAVTMFDFESLVLEAFPALYRVKCLNTTELKRNSANTIVADNELMPGAVTVVTVPWTHGRNTRNPLRPYADQATLTAVKSFLQKRVSPFVRLEVQNPSFEEVQVDFKVRFTPAAGDISFYIDELNKALVEFLTPWARPNGSEITFGGRLWKSSIIDFVEEQPEVDFITDFRLYHKVDVTAPDAGWTPIDVEVVEATTARSVLVSAARHTITEVPGHE
jgi:hypothetical protein